MAWQGDWFAFDDNDFPYAIGVAEFMDREEFLSDVDTSRLARVELVTDRDRRRHLLNVHAGIA